MSARVRERVRRTPRNSEAVEADAPTGPETSSGKPEEREVTIDVDPAISAGFIGGRFDIVLRGRVFAATPIESLTLRVDGRVIAAMQFGEAVRREPADAGAKRQHGFHLVYPQPSEQADGERRCELVARTADGRTHGAALRLAVARQNRRPVSLLEGAVTPPTGKQLAAPVILYAENAEISSDGRLRLQGWTVGATRVVTVQAFLGETRIAAAKTGLVREDVGKSYPDYPQSRRAGFSLTMPLTEAQRASQTLRVQAICLDGSSCELSVPLERMAWAADAPEPDARNEPAGAGPTRAGTSSAYPESLLGSAPQPYQLSPGFALAPNAVPTMVTAKATLTPVPTPSDPRRVIHLFFDEVAVTPDGRLRVLGWAASGVGISEIVVRLDGQTLGEADVGLLRPDVGQQFSSLPMARRSGFRFEQPVPGLDPGSHTVTIAIRNGFNDSREERRELTTQRVAVQWTAKDRAAEFRFELDSPRVTDGMVLDPITGRLTIEGWVLARSGVAGIDVLLDGHKLGEAHYGLARQDVGAAFPEWDNALRSGYAFHCPPRVLKDGVHDVAMIVRANNGQDHTVRFTLQAQRAEDVDELADIRRKVPRAEADLMAGLLADLGRRPRFHLVVRRSSPLDPDGLTLTLDSLRGQIYQDWSATILAEPAEADKVRGLIAAWDEDLVRRIAVTAATDPGWNSGLAPAAEDRLFCGLLCPGDELGADALAEIALTAGLHPESQVIYADELRTSPATQDCEPFFKPDFSPDLLLSTHYIGRPWFAEAAVLRSIGATPRSLSSHGEYDLVLRATERAASIRHVTKLLARRARAAGSGTMDTPAQERAAITRALVRRGTPGEVLPGWGPGTWRARRTTPIRGKVSIIIPTCAAKGYIKACLETLQSRTAYRDIETVVIDNIPASEPGWKHWLQENADQVVEIPGAFNWSRFNNTAVAACTGEFLLFLNDDIECVQDDWLDAMLEHMNRPEVAVVGSRLLYPDRKVQHAGMFLANDGVGRHAFRFAAQDEPGYFGLALTQRNVIAVTGACMLVRRAVFEQLGRFDERHSIVNNDLDFCLRAHQAGLLTVYSPHATLIHHELASREKLPDVFNLAQFEAQWKTLFAAGDPYFSPRLSRHSDDYRPDDEPVQTVFAGHPLFRSTDIQRILVVKLDHIGDFVTALPAIRQLKRSFPHASLTVLAGRASEAFVACEPAIDELIPFDYFHSRSQLGERTLTEADFLALRARLRPYRFDLAVDLRKHLSTRDVLKYTGARFLAGFDYMGQFPFLDIALEWDGDKPLQRKRGHVVDDLLALAQAVAAASSDDRSLIAATVAPAPFETLPDEIRPLFARPVVAIHAGAGNRTKQWPESHFVALIELLVERDGVSVVLVGGPDDEAASDAIRARVRRPEQVGSMVGRTRLSELPGLLLRCAMYVGNDSGPKHIAAALGVPTIGIHSGVVDAAEWGPMGARSVAIRRSMNCGPCYLANADDCPRDLACLRLLEPALVHQMAQALLARPVTETVAMAREREPPAPSRPNVRRTAVADPKAISRRTVSRAKLTA